VIVLSDTSPLNYLVLIGHVDVLPILFGEVVVPKGVSDELQRSGAPEAVRLWVASRPTWLVIRTPSRTDDSIELGMGEVEAISLAMELHADLLLMDDRLGRRAAESRGLSVAGTINVLEAAAERDLLDLPVAVAKLRHTNFHISEQILANALAADVERRRSHD
jgi:predicted nucleic acid-binding protein